MLKVSIGDPDAYEEFCQRIGHAGFRELVGRVTAGYSERTPNGMHLFYRCPDGVEGNLKLAMWPDADGKPKAVIETRGEGGYCVTAPSYGSVHPSSKEYGPLTGGPESVATLTAGERATLLAIARQVDLIPVEL